jgi:hypothetical protein
MSMTGGVDGRVEGGIGDAGQTVGSVSREGGVGEEGWTVEAVLKRVERIMHSAVGWSVSLQMAQGEGARHLPLLLYPLLVLHCPLRR